jgi:hypothetical protein
MLARRLNADSYQVIESVERVVVDFDEYANIESYGREL